MVTPSHVLRFPGQTVIGNAGAALCIVAAIAVMTPHASAREMWPVDPVPVHGLDAFMQRQGVKPYGRFRDGDGFRTHRLIFEDRRFGTTVWMIDDSPTSDPGMTASVWPAWNADASLMVLAGARPDADDQARSFAVNADCSRLLPHQRVVRPIWDRQDPEIYFIHNPGQVIEVNMRDNTQRVIAQWRSYPRERIYGLTRDNRYLFVDTPNGGIWLQYEPGETPIPRTGLHDGRPAAPRADGSPSHPSDRSEVLNVGRNSVWETSEWGPLFRVRIGLRIDRHTGAIEHVIVPLDGHQEYLRTFKSHRVKFPQGEEWEAYNIHRGDSEHEMFDIYRYYPAMTHGHESSSPDGGFIAKDGSATRIVNARTGEIEWLRLSPDGVNYHLHWVNHPRYFVAWSQGWHTHWTDQWQPGTFQRTVNANHLFQVFADASAQPIWDTKNRFSTWGKDWDFSMLSPDATKVHTTSAMTGVTKSYVAVLRRPLPPRQVNWMILDNAVILNWQPAPRNRETRGYFVYRSTHSGDGYELLTREPVKDTFYLDASAQSDRVYHYVVTALEHSGLESNYSYEAVVRAGLENSARNQPLVIYVEAEAAMEDLPTDARPGLAVGRDVRGASDWYYVYRHPRSASGEIAMEVPVPTDGAYHLWARVRLGQDAISSWRMSQSEETEAPARWTIGLADAVYQVPVATAKWRWLRISDSPVSLSAGTATLTFATQHPHVEMDMLALATDAAFAPRGPRPLWDVAPPPVNQLQARNIEPRVNALQWQPCDSPMFSHYHVYAATEPIARDQLNQHHRIASPTDPMLVDWGLRAGENYHYAVTVVDRRGNESEPIFAAAQTPPRDRGIVTLELAFADAELEGDFERGEADGLRGPSFIVPRQRDHHASWRIDIPHEGDYYLWLRGLERGSGRRQGGANQRIAVVLNEERLATLGNGPTDINAPDEVLRDHPLAQQLWTWIRPGSLNLESIRLPAGRHRLTLENMHSDVRYDVLLITDEPTFTPSDGRLHQR